MRKPEAADSGTSMEPEAIISKPEAAGSGACVEPEQAKNNPNPSPLLGPFFHTDFLAENGFFFVGLLRDRGALAGVLASSRRSAGAAPRASGGHQVTRRAFLRKAMLRE